MPTPQLSITNLKINSIFVGYRPTADGWEIINGL